ncbi:MAG: D-alanyl-D-alanine carboxypeptidase [Bacteroidota bacterium]
MRLEYIKNNKLLILLAFICLHSACQPGKRLSRKNTYKQQILHSPIFSGAHTGFALYDPEKAEMLFEYQSAKYFTPASNTKILTLYSALKILGDSIPSLRYWLRGDSLFFEGTANPMFLHPRLPADSSLLLFLQRRSEKLFFCPGSFQEQPLGPGWAWDDYPYVFQSERSAFPIHSNVCNFYQDSLSNELMVYPPFFKSFVIRSPEVGSKTFIRRELNSNYFQVQGPINFDFEWHQPFQYSDTMMVRLLSELLGKRVELSNELSPIDPQIIHQYGTDSLYRRMMYRSDNFLAEQLLLACAGKVTDTLQAKKAVAYVKKNFLQNLPDDPIWVDGSGLSRYNLLTPRSLVAVLSKMYEEFPTDYLLSLFPAGGQRGTIKKWYAASPPYVYAKTGSMSNVHCLSGYLRTVSGRLLTFSFMHNGFKGSSKRYKLEMEKVLEEIRKTVK